MFFMQSNIQQSLVQKTQGDGPAFSSKRSVGTMETTTIGQIAHYRLLSFVAAEQDPNKAPNPQECARVSVCVCVSRR